MIRRLHISAVLTALAGMAGLAAIAMKSHFLITYSAICIITVCGFVLVASLQKQRAMLERAGQALGQFMRGQWGARLQPDAHDDEFSRLQHRINNMLDTLDMHLRGDAAAIDANAHAEYTEKLKFTALYESLTQHKSLEEIKADRSPTESAAALLTQLGHSVTGLFSGEQKKTKAEEIFLDRQSQQLRSLRAVAAKLQGATAQLAQRSMSVRNTSAPALSPASIDALMAKIAEQATVVSLNVAIEAARAPAGSSLADMGGELHGIATQLHKARADMAAVLASAVPHADTTPSVPLSFAVEALTSAEAVVREQIEASEQALAESEQEDDTPAEEAA